MITKDAIWLSTGCWKGLGRAGHGKQASGPACGARTIIGAVQAEQPAVHLLIRGYALDQVRSKLEDRRREIDDWETVTRSTDLSD